MATEYLMNTKEYPINEAVIGPSMYSGSFFKSNTAATGIPKLDTGPQKWVVNTYLSVSLVNILRKDMVMIYRCFEDLRIHCQFLLSAVGEKSVSARALDALSAAGVPMRFYRSKSDSLVEIHGGQRALETWIVKSAKLLLSAGELQHRSEVGWVEQSGVLVLQRSVQDTWSIIWIHDPEWVLQVTSKQLCHLWVVVEAFETGHLPVHLVLLECSLDDTNVFKSFLHQKNVVLRPESYVVLDHVRNRGVQFGKQLHLSLHERKKLKVLKMDKFVGLVVQQNEDHNDTSIDERRDEWISHCKDLVQSDFVAGILVRGHDQGQFVFDESQNKFTCVVEEQNDRFCDKFDEARFSWQVGQEWLQKLHSIDMKND